ncbi:MAG: Hemolysins and related proteins containing CBS domains, partial [uncultured Gemmatimonadetes bacterium]
GYRHRDRVRPAAAGGERRVRHERDRRGVGAQDAASAARRKGRRGRAARPGAGGNARPLPGDGAGGHHPGRHAGRRLRRRAHRRAAGVGAQGPSLARPLRRRPGHHPGGAGHH